MKVNVNIKKAIKSDLVVFSISDGFTLDELKKFKDIANQYTNFSFKYNGFCFKYPDINASKLAEKLSNKGASFRLTDMSYSALKKLSQLRALKELGDQNSFKRAIERDVHIDLQRCAISHNIKNPHSIIEWARESGLSDFIMDARDLAVDLEAMNREEAIFALNCDYLNSEEVSWLIRAVNTGSVFIFCFESDFNHSPEKFFSLYNIVKRNRYKDFDDFKRRNMRFNTQDRTWINKLAVMDSMVA